MVVVTNKAKHWSKFLYYCLAHVAQFPVIDKQFQSFFYFFFILKDAIEMVTLFVFLQFSSIDENGNIHSDSCLINFFFVWSSPCITSCLFCAICPHYANFGSTSSSIGYVRIKWSVKTQTQRRHISTDRNSIVILKNIQTACLLLIQF